MKKAIIIITTILLSYGNCYSKNVSVSKTYGNINVISYAYNYHEEINKTLIIGQLAEMLSLKMQCNEKITIIFSENHFEKADIKAWRLEEGEAEPLTQSDIPIRIFFRMESFDIIGCLNIIENVLLYKNNLKKIENKHFQVFKKNPSKSILKIISAKIDRPNEIKEIPQLFNISYYEQNGKFYLIKKLNNEEIALAVFDEILELGALSDTIIVVFTSKDEFTIVNQNSPDIKVHINDVNSFFKPFDIRLLGNDKIVFQYDYNVEKNNRVMLYHLSRKIFVQDLDKVLEN